MNSDIAVKVEGLGKRYQIGKVGKQLSILEFFEDFKKNIRRKKKEDFWALQDVSLEIGRGDVVGIIGRNGAGKSTLLKILSRITAPTTGKVTLRGRVASLLEVGTGFNPELTGRENIYLNGSILGMTKAEIRRKFDEIVEFSGVDKFIDTPVKRYSSGMYVRLAFAVAAHLESEILIVDEVLAVGDAEFQKKCLGKMSAVARSGRTVLFVSHNMGAVRDLCEKVVVLSDGQSSGILSTAKGIKYYLASCSKDLTGSSSLKTKGGELELHGISIEGQPTSSRINILAGRPLEIQMSYVSHVASADLCVSFGVRRVKDDSLVIYTHNQLENVMHTTAKSGNVEVSIPIPVIAPGDYILELEAWLNSKFLLSTAQVARLRVDPFRYFDSKTNIDDFPSSLLVNSVWNFFQK